jgi:hypothetical protein
MWSGVVWYGLVWSGVVWCGLVWSGLSWSGLVWFVAVLSKAMIVLSLFRNIKIKLIIFYILRQKMNKKKQIGGLNKSCKMYKKC